MLRGGRRILDEARHSGGGQLLEFIAQQKRRCLRKGNAAITQAKIAQSVRPKSEICAWKGSGRDDQYLPRGIELNELARASTPNASMA
jgi:hypothetical protein